MSRILIISSEFPPGPGGIGQHSASMAVALSEYHDIVVLCNQDYVSYGERNIYNNSLPERIKVYNFRKGKFFTRALWRFFQIVRIIIINRPMKVISTGRFQLWASAILKLFFNGIVFEGFAHGSEVTNGSGLKGVITNFACARLDKVWAVSTFTSRILLQRGLRNVEILPNGVDNNLLNVDEKFFKPFEQWQGNPSLLTVGNMTYRKGQHRVIQALPEILKKYPNLHYHVVGLPTKKSEFIQLAEDLGVIDSITFHGFFESREDLMRAYKSSDIFIMLSENQKDGDVEGFGIALLEANIYRVPTIGAKGCGIEDAISEKSGVLVDGNNKMEIVQALDIILTNYETFQEGSRKWAEEHDWSKIILKMN